MSKNKHKLQLTRAFNKQQGICLYCDGATWIPSREGREAARRRLGIPSGLRGSTKLLRAATATREHLHRRAEGGTNAHANIKMACQFCNTARHEAEPDMHRIDMQALVAAGLHPTNRPKGIKLDGYYKLGVKAINALRAGKEIVTHQHGA